MLLYDEYKSAGGILHAADYLVRKAFPGARTESSVAWFRLEDFYSAMRIRLAAQHRPLGSIAGFLLALITGYGEGEEGLYALDSSEQLQRLGKQCRSADGPDPYLLLRAVYGDAQLMGFSDHIQEAFATWGRGVTVTAREEHFPPVK